METTLRVELHSVSELCLLDVAQVLLLNEGALGPRVQVEVPTPVADVLDEMLGAIRRELINRWRGVTVAEVPVELALSGFTPYWRGELRQVFVQLAEGYRIRQGSTEPRYASYNAEAFKFMDRLVSSLREVQSGMVN